MSVCIEERAMCLSGNNNNNDNNGNHNTQHNLLREWERERVRWDLQSNWTTKTDFN